MNNSKRIIILIPVFLIIMALSVCFSAAKISVSSYAENSSVPVFKDVSYNSWYYKTVLAMTEKGWLTGYPDGSFKPDGIITGAEFTSVVARVTGLEASTDTQSGHWAAGLLQAALNKGYYSYDELPPSAEKYDKPIERQLAVSITMRGFAPGASGDYSTESIKMKDFSQLDGRYYNTTFAAYSSGISQGDSDGCFRPHSSLTRAEACALILRAAEKFGSAEGHPADTSDTSAAIPPSMPESTITRSGGVSQNGQLQVIGTQLCNAYGQAVVLHGMSTHGIHWFPEYASAESIRSTADAGANLFRIAMYTDENGYISNNGIRDMVISAADAAISNDMYVIIDWHILSDGDPLKYITQSKQFFAEMAQRYSDSPAVLYEICNEPNGNITWDGNVKPYANEVIKVIRAYDSDAVILVGSPTWSQDLDKVAASPLQADNIMYSCHFYAGTHTQWLRDRISSAIKSGIPVFVTEWGTSDASGGGGVYLEESQRWIDFMNENKISWANWSLCDKQESSAALIPDASPAGGFSQDELTVSGKFVFSCF